MGGREICNETFFLSMSGNRLKSGGPTHFPKAHSSPLMLSFKDEEPLTERCRCLA